MLPTMVWSLVVHDASTGSPEMSRFHSSSGGNIVHPPTVPGMPGLAPPEPFPEPPLLTPPAFAPPLFEPAALPEPPDPFEAPATDASVGAAPFSSLEQPSPP